MIDKKKTSKKSKGAEPALMNPAEASAQIADSKTGELTNVNFYKFEDFQLLMKGGEWFLTMTLNTYIQKLWMNYTMRWVVDLTKYINDLEDVAKDRRNYKDSLLPEEDEKVQTNFDRREAEILNQKALAIQQFETIELDVAVEKMSRKSSGDTNITFKIADSAINQLNNHRNDEEEYKVCLIRE